MPLINSTHLQFQWVSIAKLNIPNADIQNKHLINTKQLSFDYKLEKALFEITSAFFIKKTNIENKTEKIYGAECFGKIYITNKLEAQISYTIIDATINSGKIKYKSKYDLDYFIRSSLQYKFRNNLTISSIALLRQGNYYTPTKYGEFDEFTETYKPIYSSIEQQKRLNSYAKIDMSISKSFSLTDETSLIMFFNASNILNKKNERSINYNDDYTKPFNELYSKRTIYFGGLVNF